LLHHCAQFDFITVAKKAWQRGIDEQRLGNLHRRTGVSAELIRFRLADRDNAIRRKIIRCGEIERRLAIAPSLQTPLPERERPKFLAQVGNVRQGFFAAITDDESLLGETLLRDLFDIILKRLIASDRKRIPGLKAGQQIRESPIAKFQHCIVNCENDKIDISNRLAFRRNPHFAVDGFAWLHRSVCEMRLDL
jgi:hypothetical protein